MDSMCADGQLSMGCGEVQVKTETVLEVFTGGRRVILPTPVGTSFRGSRAAVAYQWRVAMVGMAALPGVAPIFRSSRLVYLMATLDSAKPLENPAHLVRSVFWHRYSLYFLCTFYVRDRVYAIKI